MYVSGRDNNSIQKFTHNGTFILKWGSKGIGDGQFKSFSCRVLSFQAAFAKLFHLHYMKLCLQEVKYCRRPSLPDFQSHSSSRLVARALLDH
jgi:hypothetical protein